ncbi:MAG: methylenetetrahydrofolate reductase, partial [Gammaproteobacteria bacterium]|nr:methylenetetrahydrofolate reductase [Gammaproteobacteria bacterium]
MESQNKFTKKFSFEFFPPKTPEAVGKLQTTQEHLARLKPDFFSVTFGAGGSTRERTFETVMDIFHKTGIEGVPHVSCIGSTTEEILSVLNSYMEAGIHKVVALRGDLPSGSIGTGSLRYASELVEFIRKETGDHFYIEVAAYP